MKRLCSTQDTDRISCLPEPIQCHIVSFLPMKEAMRTTALSKRWGHICSSLSNMEFDWHDCRSYNLRKVGYFRDFVDDVISRHNGSNIREFLLHPGNLEFISSCFINACISFAVGHNVQVLNVCEYYKLERLPLCFFTCNTLTELEFESMKIKWPAFAKFPMLRRCCLWNIIFSGDNTLSKLFSSSTFPVLEELELLGNKLNVETLSISIPSLKYLNIVEVKETIVKVSGSTLDDLVCDLCVPLEIGSENLPSLCSADFAFHCHFLSSGDLIEYPRCDYALKTLIKMPNLVTLSLDCGFLEFLVWDQELLSCLPSLPRSLEHLSLCMIPTENHIGVAILLLRSFSHLETLHINFKENQSARVPVEYINEQLSQQVKDLSPANILNCLRTVTIEGFTGGENEIRIMRYLLDNAKRLEEMRLVPRDFVGPRENWHVSIGTYPNVKISHS